MRLIYNRHPNMHSFQTNVNKSLPHRSDWELKRKNKENKIVCKLLKWDIIMAATESLKMENRGNI